MVRVLAFDLGGVLFSDGTREFIEYLRRAHGVDTAHAGELLHGDLGSRYREGTVTRDEFWGTFRHTLRLEDSADDLAARWIDGYRIDEGTRDLIRDVSARYAVYYLSDNVADRVEAVEDRYGFLNLFTGGVFSHEVGVRKPDRRIYEHLLWIAEADAEDVVFVDDKQWALDPAAQLGMATVLFQHSDQARHALAALGVCLEA
ncbi:HAD-IA family hydrolase [Hamadaea sp. NPDC051192]|uniref:HAD-IA family hydrolase n=1 Tax=Hamadaea sp. NPDC051192 TaxID=3154940 RepID=UPI00344A9C36